MLPRIGDRIGTGAAFAANVLCAIRRRELPASAVATGLLLGVLKHSLSGNTSLFGDGCLENFIAGQHKVRR
jgi:2-dehydro-3-deoxygluconokinase